MRYVLLDRITALEPPEVARGLKCVSLSDEIFVDHFPGHPVMPGALVLESLAQLAGVLLEATLRQRGRNDLHALLTMVDRAKFRHMVRPGDRLELEARVLTATADGGQVKAWARIGAASAGYAGWAGSEGSQLPSRDGQVATEAELSYAFARVTNPKLIAKRREFLNIWLTGSAEEP
jgi:3-hydroxyacyl-[acyl-carrier-protein] dehydratase